MKTISIALTLIALAGIVSAQGTDLCTTPQVVVGAGPFNFDNSTATAGTQGQSEALCTQFGSTVIKRDVWFTWNATFSGWAVVETCGIAGGVDTKVGVYPGTTCPTAGTAIGCNDDSGCPAFASRTNSFAITMGSDYVIQIGVYPIGTVAGGPGMFAINPVTPPANDDCSTPMVIGAPGQYAFDTSYATTGGQGQSETVCLLNTAVAPIYRDLWYTYTASSNMVQVKTCDLVNITSPYTDTRIAVYPGVACPAANTAFGCADDGDDNAIMCALQGLTTDLRFPTVCGGTYLIQLGEYNRQASIDGLVEFAEIGSLCNTPFTVLCSGDGTDTACPCSNPGLAGRGCENTFTTGGAALSSTGIASVAADTLVLHGNFAVPFGPGLYYEGNATANPSAPFGLPFGHGLRCAGGATNRLEIRFADNVGSSSTTVSLQAFGAAVASTTYYYQQWYRDTGNVGTCLPGAGFNLSNLISLTWAP